MNYAIAKQRMRDWESFDHTSMSARAYADGTYWVYSYGTRILAGNWQTKEVYQFDNRRYSVTTSKHQRYIREVFGEGITGGYDHRVVYELVSIGV